MPADRVNEQKCRKAEAQRRAEQGAVVTEKAVFRGRTIAVRQDTLKRSDGSEYTWDAVVHPGAVVLIPVTEKGKIVLIEQWRRVVGKVLIELPAGTLEAGEPIEVCAQRELQEETGFWAKKISSLGGFYSAPGYSTEYLHVFVCEGLEHRPLESDEDEAIDLCILTLDAVEEKIASGEICDTKTLAGIHRYVKWCRS